MSLLGNLSIHEEMKRGNIYSSNGILDLDGMGIDVHLDHHFYFMKMPSKTVNIVWNNPEDMFEYVYCQSAVVLPPTSITLATTVEIVGSRSKDIACLLNTRSTLARFGISIHTGAIVSEPGFCNKWTLELINNTTTEIEIPIHSRVGTVYFTRVEMNNTMYKGSYSEEWTPRTMLPKERNM